MWARRDMEERERRSPGMAREGWRRRARASTPRTTPVRPKMGMAATRGKERSVATEKGEAEWEERKRSVEREERRP
jgi:hypothetical protein